MTDTILEYRPAYEPHAQPTDERKLALIELYESLTHPHEPNHREIAYLYVHKGTIKIRIWYLTLLGTVEVKEYTTAILAKHPDNYQRTASLIRAFAAMERATA